MSGKVNMTLRNDAVQEPRIHWEELAVNEAIRRYPGTVTVFNRFGIDACCGGAMPIPEAADRDGADTEELIDALAEVAAAEP
jgi:regulator of cell morphogenesis and NO signaling